MYKSYFARLSPWGEEAKTVRQKSFWFYFMGKGNFSKEKVEKDTNVTETHFYHEKSTSLCMVFFLNMNLYLCMCIIGQFCYLKKYFCHSKFEFRILTISLLGRGQKHIKSKRKSTTKKRKYKSEQGKRKKGKNKDRKRKS